LKVAETLLAPICQSYTHASWN